MPSIPGSFRFFLHLGIHLPFRNTDQYTLGHHRGSWPSPEGHSPLVWTSGTYWYKRQTALLLLSLDRIGWFPSNGIPRIFWGLGTPDAQLFEVLEYTKSPSWSGLRQNTSKARGSHFRRRSNIGGTLTFHSICRATRGNTVLRAVIFALWQFRNTGPGLESRT